MANRFTLPFYPIDSTKPSFLAAVDNTSALFALEATGREWLHGPGSRSIRIAAQAADDFYVQFGSSLAVCTQTTDVLILGGTVEVLKQIKPAHGYIALVSSTDITANITLGYGQ